LTKGEKLHQGGRLKGFDRSNGKGGGTPVTDGHNSRKEEKKLSKGEGPWTNEGGPTLTNPNRSSKKEKKIERKKE